MSCRAKLHIPVEKQHTCDACGCVFRYTTQTTICGVAMGQEAALADLRRRLPRQLEQLRKNPDSVVERHPCPGCGCLPPEMNLRTVGAHGGVLLASFFVLLGAFCLAADPGLKRSASETNLAWFGVVAFTVVAAGHVVAAWTNPNRDPRANRRRAKREVAGGIVRVVTPGVKPAAPCGPANLSIGQLSALLLVLLAPLPFFSALSYRARGPAVKDNPHLKPTLVSPGDEFTCALPGLSVEGLGRWRGRPTVRVLNAKEVGIRTLPARGNDEVWGHELEVHVRSGDRLENRPLDPVVSFTMPDDPNLGGQELRLQVDMKITYVFVTGFDTFVDRTTPISSRFTVQVAPPGYTEGLHQAYMVGLIGGGLSLLGGLGLMLACIRWKRKASEIFLPEPEAIPVG
jgi:hypothetical protein